MSCSFVFVNCQNFKIVSFQFTLIFDIFLLSIDKCCSIWKSDGYSCWLYWNIISGGRWILSKYLNTITFPKISAKVEKAASRKGQMKNVLIWKKNQFNWTHFNETWKNLGSYSSNYVFIKVASLICKHNYWKPITILNKELLCRKLSKN